MQTILGRSWKRGLLALAPERLQVAAWAIRCYRRKFHKWPRLVRPQSFNELIVRRKILDRDLRIVQCADKVVAKDLVRDLLGDDWITPTLWSGPVLPPVAERTWPKPFVIKANNGCGWNLFVRSEAACDWPMIEARCQSWMSSVYGTELGEWFYERMPPQLLVEPFINFNDDLPYDVKFWVFYGRVEFIHIVADREHAEKHAFFDRHWNRIIGHQGYPEDTSDLRPPVSLDKMIQAAEKLGKDFSFVRIDFYEIDGKPRFGEMTFYPGSGLNGIGPESFDRQLVALWRGKRPMPVGGVVAATT